MHAGSSPLGFTKEERLCSKTEIDRLFAQGQALTAFPLRVVFVSRDELPSIVAKTMFVVPKKNFRRAHDRNLIRRRMREAFRHHKAGLYQALRTREKRLSMAFMFSSREYADYATIEKATVKLLEKLTAAL